MGRKDKDMSNKAKTPSPTKVSKQTKHRKGGAKVRKLAPQRRLNRTLDQFIDQNHAAHVQTGRKEALHLTKVREEGITAVLGGEEYQSYLHRTNIQRPDPKKLARQLMPNARW